MKAIVPDKRSGAKALWLLESFRIGTMGDQAIVQAHSARNEATRLRIVDAVDEAHEFAHHVHMVPRRPEGFLHHDPTLGKYHEVHVGRPGDLGARGQHGIDRWIGVVEQNRSDRREAAQIVFHGREVAMPSDDVKRCCI
jgi:hypothetical protein